MPFSCSNEEYITIHEISAREIHGKKRNTVTFG